MSETFPAAAYDAWKTAAPEPADECSDGCGREATTVLDGRPLCRECVKDYHPDL